ncbi:TRAF-like superfamily protein [Striga hermonthica]|uniref:TRAF-like superfamily protein n=1 Tax=Striga hermonthica TaxID=68872 RepID=A0A9N7RU17_STRHE|nr:TRAF-like superfamily protein [Striga hermonthica]
MNPPADDTELTPEKLGEEKEGGALFHCHLYDADIVHKIAEEFLPGLASACVDNTTGGLFRSPASVAVDIRREMVDYLTQRSENFVVESVVLEGGPNIDLPEDPYDIISDFIDDFASSKRNFFSRVSGWLLSERREDRIDDFSQEMEIGGFWLLNRRESVAHTILKNADFNNMYHCSLSFKSEEELEAHKLNCSFRTINCLNEGCNFRFSAAQMEQHDQTCPFKIIQCEQNCSESIMRRDMDRHCITVCPMKLVKCPFYSVGCHSSIPQCTIEQHRSESLDAHLICILQLVYKEAKTEDLKERVEELTKLASTEKLAAARDVRSLTFAIKDLDAKLGPLKLKTAAESDDEVNDLTDEKDEKDEKTASPNKKLSVESLRTNTETANSPPKVSDYKEEEKVKGMENGKEEEKMKEMETVKEMGKANPPPKLSDYKEEEKVKDMENENEMEKVDENENKMEEKNKKEMERKEEMENRNVKESEKQKEKLVEPTSSVTEPSLELEPDNKNSVASAAVQQDFNESPRLARGDSSAEFRKADVLLLENPSKENISEPPKYEHV